MLILFHTAVSYPSPPTYHSHPQATEGPLVLHLDAPWVWLEAFAHVVLEPQQGLALHFVLLLVVAESYVSVVANDVDGSCGILAWVLLDGMLVG
ncbi:hypothetical protein U1Q18_035475 [Sarracenia purpurea var. burkii]